MRKEDLHTYGRPTTHESILWRSSRRSMPRLIARNDSGLCSASSLQRQRCGVCSYFNRGQHRHREDRTGHHPSTSAGAGVRVAPGLAPAGCQDMASMLRKCSVRLSSSLQPFKTGANHSRKPSPASQSAILRSSDQHQRPKQPVSPLLLSIRCATPVHNRLFFADHRDFCSVAPRA